MNDKSIIFDLLIILSKRIGRKYEKYFKIEDDDVCDNILCIYLDKIKNREDYKYDSGYRYYLLNFERRCEEFIKELNNELPEYIYTDECYFTLDNFGNGKNDNKRLFYESCQIEFKIKNSEVI